MLPCILGMSFAGLSAQALAPGNDGNAYQPFFGTAFAITALPLPGRIVLEFKMTRSEWVVSAISAAAINDVVGWLLACVTVIAIADFDAGGFGLRLLALVDRVAVCSWLVCSALHTLLRRNDVTSQPLPPDVVGFEPAAVFVSALTTCRFGILTIFGGFMIGVLLHDHPGLLTVWCRHMNSSVTVFLLPIFLTCTGLRIDVGAMMNTRVDGSGGHQRQIRSWRHSTTGVFNARADGDRQYRHHHAAAEALAFLSAKHHPQ